MVPVELTTRRHASERYPSPVDLRMFAEIARSHSMAVAGSRLGKSPATISGRLKALEEHYGVTLVRRTTRSLILTEEGRLMLERAEDLLSGFQALERDMRAFKRAAQGRLVISSPAHFGRRWIVPMAHDFAALHPDVDMHFDFDSGEAQRDARADVSIRIGALPPSTLTTRKLTDIGLVTCASPVYLKSRGVPEQPSELRSHDCLRLIGGVGCDDVWDFMGPAGPGSIRVNGRQSSSDPLTLVELALLGHGILRTQLWDVEDDLAAGKLVAVLTRFEPAALPVNLLSERRSLLPLKTIRFIDFAVDRFRRPADARFRPRGVAGNDVGRLCA